MGSCDNNEGIFSEESESLGSLEFRRMGIRLFAMSSNKLRFCLVARRHSSLAPFSLHLGMLSNNILNDSSDVTTNSAYPLDWPLILFSANLMSLMSLTPKFWAMFMMSWSDVHQGKFPIYNDSLLSELPPVCIFTSVDWASSCAEVSGGGTL